MAPDALPDPIQVAVNVGGVFDGLGVSYLVAGSLASSVHGEPRSTNDVDLVADIAPGQIAPLLAALGDAFDAERLSQRKRVQLDIASQSDLWVDLPEHTVLRKLEWYRRGGEVSERQWRDALGVLRAQGARLDQARLVAWADRVGVRDLLDRAQGEVGYEHPEHD